MKQNTWIDILSETVVAQGHYFIFSYKRNKTVTTGKIINIPHGQVTYDTSVLEWCYCYIRAVEFTPKLSQYCVPVPIKNLGENSWNNPRLQKPQTSQVDRNLLEQKNLISRNLHYS